MPTPEQIVGQCIRELRLKAKVSTHDFASLVGLRRIALENIESGRVSPTLAILVKIAEGLGMKPADLLKDL